MMHPRARAWNKRRGAVSHDWLQNQFNRALGKWLNILDGLVEDPAVESRFVAIEFRRWEVHAEEARRVVEEFEHCMSPRSLLECPPLSSSGPDSLEWLASVVHALWLSRLGVPRLIDEVNSAIDQADESYVHLRTDIAASGDDSSIHGLRLLRPQFGEFYERCQAVGAAISSLPREVSVA